MRLPVCSLILILLINLIVVPASKAAPCLEYFTSTWGETLDMSNSGDILDNFPVAEHFQLSQYSYSGGILKTTTTGTDPWFRILSRAIDGQIADRFTTRFGTLKPINSSTYKQLIIRMNTDKASVLQVFWDKPNGSLGQTGGIATQTGWQTYVVNLDVSNWSVDSSVMGIRIDPSQAVNALIEVDYIYLTPAGCTEPDIGVAPIIQPDAEGGYDFFSSVKQNAVNFDSATDFESIGGVSSATLFPSNAYQDSNGAVRRGDFIEANTPSGGGDPAVHFVFPGSAYPIDAAFYKIACWTIDILLPTTEYHSVQRIFWTLDGNIQTSDDIVSKITGEARYCFRLDTIGLEPALAAGQAHPWRNNSDGSGLTFFRIDPHEEVTPTKFRFSDARLASDHLADTQYAVVVGGSRAQTVALYYRRGSESAVQFATLNPNRNTDIALLNTTNLPEGSYTISSVVGLTVNEALGPLVVRHDAVAADTIAPSLHVDAPLTGHIFDTSLQIVGYALDNRRIARIEAFVDGALIDSFAPSDFDARARAQVPSAPFASESGFNRFVDTSSISRGPHAFSLVLTDTAGNSVVHTATITKDAVNLTPSFSPPFSEAGSVAVKPGLQERPSPGTTPTSPPSPGQARATLSASLRGTKVSFAVASKRGKGTCPSLKLLGAPGVKNASFLVTQGTTLFAGGTSSFKASSSSLKKFNPRRKNNSNTKISFVADCGNGTQSAVRTVDVVRISGRKKVGSLAKAFELIRANFVVKIQ